MQVAVVVRRRLVGESVRAALGLGEGEVTVHLAGDGDVDDDVRDADVVLVSSRVPFEEVSRLARRHHGRVVVFGGPPDTRLARLGVQSVGDDGLDRIRQRVLRLAAGERPASTSSRRVAHPEPPRRPGYDELTGRELDVLDLMLTGADNARIAAELAITVNTVRTHVQNIFSKLGVHSRFEAVTVCLREGAHDTRRTLTGS